MILGDGALVSNDVLELSYIVIIIILCQVLHDLVICQDIIIGILIDTAPELDIVRGILTEEYLFTGSYSDIWLIVVKRSPNPNFELVVKGVISVFF